MLELSYQNGMVCVYDVEVWETLRKDYRIIGDLLGNTSFLPVLPLKLLPEEAYLLVNKEIAQIVEYPDLKNEPTESHKTQYEDSKKELLINLQEIYRNSRKRQLESFIDKIVVAKRKKGDERTTEDIFEEELNKMVEITEDNMIYPNQLRSPEEVKGKPRIVPKEKLLEHTTIENCNIFTDLWEKGYCITSGTKFGGDFLLYSGDPILYHAVHVVRCVADANKKIHPTEIIAFGRLANAVKKKAILANCNPSNNISYITLSWPHM